MSKTEITMNTDTGETLSVRSVDFSENGKVKVVLKDGRRFKGTYIPKSRGKWNMKEEK